MTAEWTTLSGTWEKTDKGFSQPNSEGLFRIYCNIRLEDFILETSFIMENPSGGESKIIFSDADKNENYRIDFMSGVNLCRITAGGNLQFVAPLQIISGKDYHVRVTVRRNFVSVVVNELKIIVDLEFGKTSDGNIGLGTFNTRATFTLPTVAPFVIKKCFVIMQFDEKRDFLYETVIIPTLENHPNFVFEHSRADRILTTGKITDEIDEHLKRDDIIIADVSEPNLNVYYELGVAHASNRKAILLKQETREKSVEVPFDIKTFRIHGYEFSTKGFSDLKLRLRDVLTNSLQ